MKHILWRLSRYIKHNLTSKNRHGIHSPFVYKFLDEIVYNSTPYYIYKAIEQYRKSLDLNTNTLEIVDYGAGSSYTKSNERKITEIAKQSVKREKYAQLLFRIAEQKQAKTIVELGTSLGITTLYLSYANPKCEVISLEGSPSLVKFARSLMKKFKRNNVEIIEGEFNETIPALLDKNDSFDMVFFDGHHNEEATLNYFNLFLDKVKDDTLFVFDDIHWSPGMERAWNKIRMHNHVTLTLDFFEMGLVYFMPRKQKEHFRIRF